MTPKHHYFREIEEVVAISPSGSAIPIVDRPILRWELAAAAGARPSGVWIARRRTASSF
jgi:hypothetical protein